MRLKQEDGGGLKKHKLVQSFWQTMINTKIGNTTTESWHKKVKYNLQKYQKS